MRLLIAAPFLLLLVLFALTNRAPVTLGLWPTGLSLEAPLSLVILAAAAVAFLAGGLVVWVNELGQRRRARRAEAQIRKLDDEIAALRARLKTVASVAAAAPDRATPDRATPPAPLPAASAPLPPPGTP
jgi:lipopolysaccharide assembly protein A